MDLFKAKFFPFSVSVMVKRGHRNLMLIPIAFVNEHIETLHELDIEYADEVGKECGAEKIARCPTPNDHPAFIDAMADIVSKHLSQVENGVIRNFGDSNHDLFCQNECFAYKFKNHYDSSS